MVKEGNLSLETKLTLALPGGGGGGDGDGVMEKNEKKRLFSEFSGEESKVMGSKNPVVGWPPVCSYRLKKSGCNGEGGMKMYVKVSMDGAPFLRKIDLSAHEGYSGLFMALEKLFGCYSIGEEDISEYVPTYEDKDGDWMLVGDVPWQMFSGSCKRLRIMKRLDAKGIGLHAKDLHKAILIEA